MNRRSAFLGDGCRTAADHHPHPTNTCGMVQGKHASDGARAKTSSSVRAARLSEQAVRDEHKGKHNEHPPRWPLITSATMTPRCLPVRCRRWSDCHDLKSNETPKSFNPSTTSPPCPPTPATAPPRPCAPATTPIPPPLHHEHEATKKQLEQLNRQTPATFDLDLIDDLPILPDRVHELTERIQAEIFAALDIQILWNAPIGMQKEPAPGTRGRRLVIEWTAQL